MISLATFISESYRLLTSSTTAVDTVLTTNKQQQLTIKVPPPCISTIANQFRPNGILIPSSSNKQSNDGDHHHARLSAGEDTNTTVEQ